MPTWIDTHCHLDAPEFDADRATVRQAARSAGVALCVYPAVQASNLDTVRQLAHATRDAYALGIHPLYTPQAVEGDLTLLESMLVAHAGDPRLVALGEIGLDYFVPGLDAAKQEHFYREQLKLARNHGLPVILHVRRSADRLLKSLRELAPAQGWSGIAHAFNGSDVQAKAFTDLGFVLGFGGAVTFERALQLRRLASASDGGSLVLETDAPDIPPHWLYRTQAQRIAGLPQGRNAPVELPRIGAELAQLRGVDTTQIADQTTANALRALPKLNALMSKTTNELL
jgi:TatD DNase family protein